MNLNNFSPLQIVVFNSALDAAIRKAKLFIGELIPAEKQSIVEALEGLIVRETDNTNSKPAIVWFDISKGELPPVDKTIDRSETVLVTNGKWIDFGCYLIYRKEWRNEQSEWQPTHWAFINYPNTP